MTRKDSGASTVDRVGDDGLWVMKWELGRGSQSSLVFSSWYKNLGNPFNGSCSLTSCGGAVDAGSVSFGCRLVTHHKTEDLRSVLKTDGVSISCYALKFQEIYMFDQVWPNLRGLRGQQKLIWIQSYVYPLHLIMIRLGRGFTREPGKDGRLGHSQQGCKSGWVLDGVGHVEK